MEKTQVGVASGHDASLLIDLMGRDCLPEQYIREFIRNSIEAIQELDDPNGDIVIDCNWGLWDMNSELFKISFIDNGTGMSPEQMCALLSNLCKSGEKNNNTKINYGVGAKISALSRNPAGLLYESWQKNVGHKIFIYKNEDTGIYELERYESNDGKFFDYEKIADDYKPNIIKDHGTRVTLFGKTLKDNTMERPEKIDGSKDFWLLSYINKRFFDIPDGIKVRVRTAYYDAIDRAEFDSKKNSIKDPVKANCLRFAKGHKSTLDNISKQSGIVELSDANIHWYILDEERKSNNREFSKGHSAVIKDGEIFELRHGPKQNRAIQFGLTFSYKDVALIIEPSKYYRQDTTRRFIAGAEGETLPWDRWMEEFADKFPVELKEFEAKAIDKIKPSDVGEKIRDKLRQFQNYFKMGKGRLNPSGKASLRDEDFDGSTGFERSGPRKDNVSRKSSRGSESGKIKELLSLFSAQDTDKKGTITSVDPWPEVRWVSTTDNTRDPGDYVDRAAHYSSEANIVFANKDFQGYKDVVENMVKEFNATSPEVTEVIAKSVYEGFERQLMEVIASVNQLAGREAWSQDSLDDAMNDEALTAAVGVRSYIVESARRDINNKLKSLKHPSSHGAA